MSEPKLEMMQVPFPEYKDQEEMLNQIAEFLKNGVDRCGKAFEDPEDDWCPMYLVVFTEGPARLITSTLHKHMLVNLIATAAKEFGAVGIGQLNSSWRLMTQDQSALKGSIAEKPGSEEGLMLSLYSRTNWRIEWAAIKRHKTKPPILAPWEVMMQRKEGEEISGMMFDPLLQALRKN